LDILLTIMASNQIRQGFLATPAAIPEPTLLSQPTGRLTREVKARNWSVISFLLVVAVVAFPQFCRADVYNFVTIPNSLSIYYDGINDAGQIVGTSFHSAFVYADGTYTYLTVPGSNGTTAGAINNAGQVVGSWTPDSGFTYYAYLYSGGSYTSITPPGSANAGASGINNVGQIVGIYGATNNGPYYSFLDTNGIFSSIDLQSFAGINDAGQIVGGQETGYLYTNGAVQTIAVPGNYTYVEGINDAGQIVGHYMTSSNIIHGFIYNNGFFTTVDFPGASGTEIRGINNEGEIVGNYFTNPNYSSGNELGFFATPAAVPEPPLFPLLAIGLGALTLRSTRIAQGRWGRAEPRLGSS
jgi:probable HAF family extracellular repeat protein